MTGAEIDSILREGIIYDDKTPYLWSDSLLQIYRNMAEREACRRASLLLDKTTINDNDGVPLTKVNLVAGQADYAISQKIIRVKKFVPFWNKIPLTHVMEGLLDEQNPFWRNEVGAPVAVIQSKGKITVTPKPVANDAQSVSGITLVGSVATANLVDHGYLAGATIKHSGADQAEYNVTAVITKIDDNNYSYSVSGAPATPATGIISAVEIDTLTLEVVRLPLADTVVVKQAVTGITRVGSLATAVKVAHGYVTDDIVTHQGAIQSDYNITAPVTRINDDSYSYVVSGEPVTPATSFDKITAATSGSPEIPEEYHFDLIDWIAHLVLSNHDKEAENLVKAREHDVRFTGRFGPALSATTESNRRRKPRNKGMRAKEFGFT